MANLMDPNEDQLAEWESFLSGMPAHVADVARRMPAWKLYRLDNGSGHYVTINSYDEPEGGGVSLNVHVGHVYNFLAFERDVFGVDPDTIVEVDIPTEPIVRGMVGL